MLSLHHLHFASAHIGAGQAPAERLLALRWHHDHCRQPVVAACREHAFLQHGAGGEYTGDAAFEQSPFGWGRFELVAEGHAETAADQLAAVALSCVVGNAGHRYATHRFAGLFAGEGEFKHAREGDGIFEEALKEIAQPVEQHPLGMGGLEFHVVAQHRGELLGIHLAVMSPGWLIAVRW